MHISGMSPGAHTQSAWSLPQAPPSPPPPWGSSIPVLLLWPLTQLCQTALQMYVQSEPVRRTRKEERRGLLSHPLRPQPLVEQESSLHRSFGSCGLPLRLLSCLYGIAGDWRGEQQMSHSSCRLWALVVYFLLISQDKTGECLDPSACVLVLGAGFWAILSSSCRNPVCGGGSRCLWVVLRILISFSPIFSLLLILQNPWMAIPGIASRSSASSTGGQGGVGSESHDLMSLYVPMLLYDNVTSVCTHTDFVSVESATDTNIW